MESFPASARTAGLFSGETLAFRQEGARLEISVPPAGPDPDVSVLTVEIDSTEKGWSEYHPPIPATIEPRKYIKDQAVSSFIVNAVLNGLLAFCAYAFYKSFTYKQVATDILEAVFIISFLTSWIMVGSARGEYKKGNLTLHPTRSAGSSLPKIPILRGLLIGVICTIVWGGLLSGLVYLISPAGMNNWIYAFFKTIYTGLSGALASALTVLSVVSDANRRKSCNVMEVLSN